MMPAMSAAYAVLRPEQIADATPQLTVVQRVGGSIGTAVLAVVLGTALTGATGPAAASAAFASAVLVGIWALRRRGDPGP
jgi:MYXO-CTERM domain-containing protein